MDLRLSSAARIAPATARNRGPILDVLRSHLPDSGIALEIAAGSGEHAVHFAAALPHMLWQPADADPEALASIAAWRALEGPPNMLSPLALDAAHPGSWPIEAADAVLCINMIHIAPWAATLGLMEGAGRILPSGGLLYLYGPFIEAGIPTTESNLAFDLDLKSRNAAWGLRDLDEVAAVATRHGLTREARIAMPAQNLSVLFRKA